MWKLFVNHAYNTRKKKKEEETNDKNKGKFSHFDSQSILKIKRYSIEISIMTTFA